ncbi:MAG: TnpV protein [Oscillospiraceae bacterium]
MTYMKLTYRQEGDYMLPNLALPEEGENIPIRKYGRMRKRYLMEHRRGEYVTLLTTGKLNEHLREVDRIAQDRRDLLIPQMAKNYGVTEELKAKDQMQWVGLMNNIEHSVDEMIREELIYD